MILVLRSVRGDDEMHHDEDEDESLSDAPLLETKSFILANISWRTKDPKSNFYTVFHETFHEAKKDD